MKELFSDTKPRKNGIEHLFGALDSEDEAEIVQSEAGMGGGEEKRFFNPGGNEAKRYFNIMQGN